MTRGWLCDVEWVTLCARYLTINLHPCFYSVALLQCLTVTVPDSYSVYLQYKTISVLIYNYNGSSSAIRPGGVVVALSDAEPSLELCWTHIWQRHRRWTVWLAAGTTTSGSIREKNISVQACHAAIQSLVIWRLDHCNILLTGLHAYQLDRLRKVHNRATRLAMSVSKFCHIIPLLMELPVCHRVTCKVPLYVFKVLRKKTASYVADLIQAYSPCRIPSGLAMVAHCCLYLDQSEQRQAGLFPDWLHLCP